MTTPETITLTPDELIAIADRSAASAVEKVVGHYRLRTAVYAALAGAICASAIAIPTTLVLSHNATSKAALQAITTARSNCHNISRVAAIEQGIYADQGQQTRVFLATSHDRFGLTDKQFAELQGEREQTERARIDQLRAIASEVCGTTTAPPKKAKPPPKKR